MIAKLFWFFTGSIVYTYLGYPLLLTILAKVRPHRSREAVEARSRQNLPAVTLMITAYNEQETIAAKLRNSLSLDYPSERLQILVAADGSDDGTVDIVRSLGNQGVELSYSPPRLGKMAAINRAMAKARGEIVVFSDANNFYQPETIRELVREFSDPCVGAVTGSKTIAKGDGSLGESEGLYWKYEAFIRRQETRLGNSTGVVGEVLAIRRDLFEPPPEVIINDDFFMAVRLLKKGYRVVFAPQARSIERVSASAEEEITRRTRIVAGRYQALAHAGQLLPWRRPLVLWQLVSHKFLRPLVPFAMIGAFLTNLIQVFRNTHGKKSSLNKLTDPWDRIMLSLQILFYGLAWIGNRVHTGRKLGKILYLPVFLVNSNLAALKGFFRYITRQQATTWQRVARRDATTLETISE